MKQKKLIATALSVMMSVMPTRQVSAADVTLTFDTMSEIGVTVDSVLGEKDYIVVLKEGEGAESVASLLDELGVVEPYSNEPREDLSVNVIICRRSIS